jgi:hypothetical protein
VVTLARSEACGQDGFVRYWHDGPRESVANLSLK